MEESSWETSRISNARGHPARGSMLPAAGLVAGGRFGEKNLEESFGRKFWDKVCFPQLTSTACSAVAAPDCILNFELI